MDKSNFRNICRICLKTSVRLSSIFTSNSEVFIQITSLASVQVLPDDSLPQEICNTCMSDLQFCFDFKIKIEQSDLELRKNLQTETIKKENSEDYREDEADLIFAQQDYSFTTNLKTEDDIDICETVMGDNTENHKPSVTNNPEVQNTLQELLSSVPPNKKSTECCVCNENFSCGDDLTRHLKTHKPIKNYSCNICGTSFMQSGTLRTHSIFQHKDTEKPYKYDETCGKTLGNYSCNICGESFMHSYTLRKHSLSKHVETEKRHKCETCKKSFEMRSSLINHIRTHTGEKPYFCGICQKNFISIAVLNKHKKIHLIERVRPFECELCSKRFTAKQSLKIHLLRHEGEKNFTCSYCSKAFLTKSVLKNHILMLHLNTYNFICQICAKAYKSKDALNNHIRKHTGEKHIPIHQCPKCEKKCHTTTHLKYHIKSFHTKERDYSCEYCSKSYFMAQHLKVHLRSHTGEQPYSCRFCQKSFYTSQMRKYHEMIHTGEKPHVCNLCGTCFTQKSTLRTHMKSHR